MEGTHCEDGRKTSLRERIKKSMGNGIHVPWSKMPEVQSSGILEKLPKNQLALEELKFCFITCEVAFNIELTEVVNLCKKSVSWADPLPVFNRRTISSTIEKVKRCSDGLLNLFEKHWNNKPMLSLAIVSKIFAEMAPQLQNFITFCTHQDDLRSVLQNAKRSKPEITAVLFSDRMNIERLLLPLQHLKLFRYLLQDIRSELISMTNHLESFHCKRALTDVTNLLEDCYKAILALHGSKYLENLERLLDESIHSCDNYYYEKFYCEVQKQRRNFVRGRSVSGKSKKSYQNIKTSEVDKKNNIRETYKFFSLYLTDMNNNSQDSLSIKSKLRRQKPIEVQQRKHFDFQKANQAFYDRLSKFETLKKNNNNLYKGNHSSVKSKFILGSPDVVEVNKLQEVKAEKSDDFHEHVYSTLEDENSDVKNISVSNEVNATNVSDFTTKISGRCKSDLLGDLKTDRAVFETETTDNTKLLALKPNFPIESSVKVQKNNISSDKENLSAIESEHTCMSDSDIPVIRDRTKPVKVKLISVRVFSVEDDLKYRKISNSEPNISNSLSLTSPRECASECEVKEGKSDLKSPYEEISLKDVSFRSTKKNKTFVSSYDFGEANVQDDNPVRDEDTRNVHEGSYEDVYCENYPVYYELMQESFTRKRNSISPSKFKKKMCNDSESDIRLSDVEPKKVPVTLLEVPKTNEAHVYEDMDVQDSIMRSSSILSNCADVPLYQAYRFRNVKENKSEVDYNPYIEPDEHVYEDITDYLITDTPKSSPNMKISKPSGSSDRVRWVDISEVNNSDLLETLDTTQIALQEAKYEIITSEASYFKSLIILDAIFISNPDLKNILTTSIHSYFFSCALKVKECSQKFLMTLLEGWQDDLMLNYLSKAISKFVECGNFQVYVDCCANQMSINKTLEYLKMKNPAFIKVLSNLETDPVCQSFTLQSFLTLPMQRITRLPLLVEAILKRLPVDVPEYDSWKNLLCQLQKVANECNEAIGKADKETVIKYEQLKQMNEKIMALGMRQQSGQKKRQQTIWNLFKMKR